MSMTREQPKPGYPAGRPPARWTQTPVRGEYQPAHRPRPKGRSLARLRLAVFERDNYTCQKCGWKPAEVPDGYDGSYALVGPAPADRIRPPGGRPKHRLSPYRLLTLGHKKPFSKGGTYTKRNLQAECSTCNYGKRGRT